MKKIKCCLEKWKDVIYFSDDPEYLNERKKEGKAVLLLLTKENRNADFSSFPFALELEDTPEIELEDSPKMEFNESTDYGECISCVPEDLEDIMDTAFLERVMLRHKHLPLIVTENERLRIRELTKEDGFAIAELFDKEGTGKYLDDFGWKSEEIAAELSEYIKKSYDISDYGIWAVCLKREGSKERITPGTPERVSGSDKTISSEPEMTLTAGNVRKTKNRPKRNNSERSIEAEAGNDLISDGNQAEELIGIVSLQPRDIEDINGKADFNNTQKLFVKSQSLSFLNKECQKQYSEDKESPNAYENLQKSIRLFRSDDKDFLSQSELLELGFALRPEFQKQGYGYEMCQLLLTHFGKDNTTFIAYADSRNNASVVLLQKLGFSLKGNSNCKR